jgi:hypothetical protein
MDANMRNLVVALNRRVKAGDVVEAVSYPNNLRVVRAYLGEKSIIVKFCGYRREGGFYEKADKFLVNGEPFTGEKE